MHFRAKFQRFSAKVHMFKIGFEQRWCRKRHFSMNKTPYLRNSER